MKNTLLYMGLTQDQYRLVRPHIAERSRTSLMWMSLVMSALAGIMIVMDVIALHQNFLIPYSIVLLAGIAIHFISRKTKSVRTIQMLSYVVLAFLFTYAIVLTASPANHDVPATSIIVYMVLFPMLVPDVAWRMFILIASYEIIYLFVSYAMKTQRVFQADMSNSLILVPLGFFVFVVVANTLAKQIWESIRNQRMEQHMVISLTDIIEDRDERTGNHVRSTAGYVRAILEEMGLDSKYAEKIVHAAPLHDIGKIKIPDAILNKPGRLTPEEFEIMKRHSEYGAEMVNKVLSEAEDEELLEIARNIAHYHHERVDGKGYPDGLKGDAIPLEARVMAVADVYDALISKRVYKDAYPREKAIAIMKEGRGTQFDSDVLDAFLRMAEAPSKQET